MCLSLERVTRAERDLLFHRRLRSELVVRILSGAQFDVAGFPSRRKTPGCLGRLLHHTGTIIAAASRFEKNNSILNGLWSAMTKSIPAFARCAPNSITSILTK